MIKKIILVLCFMAVLSVNCFPLMFGNQVDCTIRPCSKAADAFTVSNAAMGAYFYLKSNSAFQEYLSGIETGAIQTTALANAIDCMTRANEYYSKLYNEFVASEYIPAVIEKLKAFDYAGYGLKNALNSAIFESVSQLLKFGNVKGVILIFEKETKALALKLLEYKKQAESGNNSIPSLWRINQKYMEFSLFGQYVAEIFQNI